MGLLTFFPFRIVWIQKHCQTLRPEKGALSVIDIHCHILPGVDDGSDSLETSLAMAEMAAASGVEAIAATPHCNIPVWRETMPTAPCWRRSLRSELP